MADNQQEKFGSDWILSPEEFSQLDSQQTDVRTRFQFSDLVTDSTLLEGVPEERIWSLLGDVDEEMPYDGMIGVYAWLEPARVIEKQGWGVRGWLVAETPRTSPEHRVALNAAITCPSCDGEKSENIGNEGSCEECEGWGTQWADSSDPSGWFPL